MQAGDHGRVDVLGDHHLVAEVERRRVDPARQQLARFLEVGAIVRRRPAVGDVHRHTVPPAGAPRALPVVRGQRWDVAHQHGVELADVDPQLQGRRAHEAVDGVRHTLEQVLQPLALIGRDHGRVFLRAQHQIGAVEQLQIVVVFVFPHPLQHAVAPPGRAALMRHVPGGRAPAAPAAPHALVRAEAQPVGADLVGAVHVRQRTPIGALESHGYQQSPFDQHVEQALQNRLDRGRRHAPFPRDLTDRRVAAVAQPLRDQLRFLRRFPAQLRGVGIDEAREVSLLDLPVTLPPVLREDLVLRVVQCPPPPEIVEHAGDTLPQVFGRYAQGVGTVLNPRQ